MSNNDKTGKCQLKVCIQRTRDGFVLVRQARTKITTFLASIITCCIVTILFCSNYYGGDSNNHIINSAFAASVGEGSQNQLPSQQQQQQGQQQQPNITGSNIYQQQTIVLGKNIKNLIISIPNEGHEDPTAPKDLRVINQPYIPENAIVNVGTTVTWLNADAGHRHSITLADNNTKSTVFNSGRFDNFNASKPFTFNNVGAFAYSGPSYDRAVPNYKMNGTITVVNQPLAANFNTTNATASATEVGRSSNADTIVTLMVPSKLLARTISDLKNQGFTIDNQYPFTSIRGGGSATGGDKQQVLLVLTSSGKSLNQVTSALAQVASTLPYK
jgi:plastocyanin